MSVDPRHYPDLARAYAHAPNPASILRPYHPASWFHPVGIWKVLAKLKPRLPDVGGRLFLTFTLNPTLFANPSLAFETGRDQLRRVFFKLRRGVEWEGRRYVIDAPYCVKVEFHENGWAHFHVVFLTRRFLPGPLLNDIWAYGRTNVRRIRNDEFHYLLKYVTKGAGLPDWIKNRTRLRVFQSSRGFYRTPAAAKPPSKPTGRKRKTSLIGERLLRWSRTALLQTGEQFRQLILGAPFADLLAEHILSVAQDRRYLGNGHILINDLTQLIPWIRNQSESAPGVFTSAA
ncbi:MAG: hypothetical protein KIT44_01870 [Opitutaceae bacterium]|nr:hypothetical protein [Opitutaceae bacterium]